MNNEDNLEVENTEKSGLESLESLDSGTDDFAEGTLDTDASDSGEYLPEDIPIKPGFGAREYARTIGDKEYYKKEAEALRQRQEAARREKNNRYKNVNPEEESETPSSPSRLAKKGKSLDEPESKEGDSGTKQKKKNKGNVETGSDERKEEKGIISRLGDKAASLNADVAVVKNKVDAAKSGTYQAFHPIEAGKARAKAEVKKKVASVLLEYWWVVAIILVILLLILLILLLILGSYVGDGDETEGYIEQEYDFTETVVHLTNSYSSDSEKINIETLYFEDLVEGAAYAELYNRLNDNNSSEKSEIYKTFLIIARSLALSIGGYDSDTKEITIQSGPNGLPYCDINNGCKIVEYNGTYTYVSNSYTGTLPGTVIATIDPMNSADKDLLVDAYKDTKYLLLTPNSVNESIKKYDYGNVPYNQSIKNSWINYAKEGNSYKDIISKTAEYSGYKIYNLEDYAVHYTYASTDSYWWPVGSTKADANGLYSGTPSATFLSSYFATRSINGEVKFHGGIDIADYGCSSNVIIASKSGTVTVTNDSCASTGYYGNTCGGGGYGNYVMIDHGDGSMTVYGHMTKDSIAVKVGQKVTQGQKIGLMGSSGNSTGCHLHFEVRINNSKVDPLQYVSASNPRPASTVDAGYSEGSGNQQTVCLSLKQSGFSNNAVAAIMTNMQAESSFRTNAVGDGGTSYGLCQWHNGRYTNLKNYCGSNYSTAKCQISFLISELQNSYTGVYNYLLTNNSAYNMARYYCMYFEVPANRQTTCTTRASKYAAAFSTYVNNNCK